MSFETYQKILGESAIETYDRFHPQNSLELLGNEDYFCYDGTLSSEKNYMAQSLQELIGVLASILRLLRVPDLILSKWSKKLLPLGVEES
jgi:hypothetical protein